VHQHGAAGSDIKAIVVEENLVHVANVEGGVVVAAICGNGLRQLKRISKSARERRSFIRLSDNLT